VWCPRRTCWSSKAHRSSSSPVPRSPGGPAVTVDARSTVAGAARLLTKHHIKRLPVVDEDEKLVGIVSRKDLLTVFLREDEDIRAEIVERVFRHGPGIA
jgi:CBS domain-containing protein